MRLFLAFLMIISTSAFAVDICQFEETWDFEDTLKSQGIEPLRVSKDHQRFSSVEKSLIHKTVTLQYDMRDASMAEALISFADSFQGYRSGNAGEILYFNFEGIQYILVHYWPGDTEVGAYFMINKNGSFKLVAKISDSFINCK